MKINENRKKKNITHAQETSHDVSWAFPLSPLSIPHNHGGGNICCLHWYINLYRVVKRIKKRKKKTTYLELKMCCVSSLHCHSSSCCLSLSHPSSLGCVGHSLFGCSGCPWWWLFENVSIVSKKKVNNMKINGNQKKKKTYHMLWFSFIVPF